MNMMVPALVVLIIILLAVAAVAGVQQHRRNRRQAALRQLLDDADRLESGLRECRQRLDRAHAVMTTAPGNPVRGETDARQAVDAGLRLLLEHRLWIRDHSARASQKELDHAVAALAQALSRLEPQLRALDHAQRDLEQAVREHLGPTS